MCVFFLCVEGGERGKKKERARIHICIAYIHEASLWEEGKGMGYVSVIPVLQRSAQMIYFCFTSFRVLIKPAYIRCLEWLRKKKCQVPWCALHGSVQLWESTELKTSLSRWRKKREMCPTFWLFGGLPKGLISVFPDLGYWWEATEKKKWLEDLLL